MPSESEQNRENVLGDNPTFRTNTLDQSTDATGPPAESAESPSTPAQGNPGDQTDENRSGLYSIDAAEAAQGFFGSRGAGTRFVYVIDRSGSMTGGRFESARAELIRSLQSLRPPMMFHVIFYDSVYEAMPARRMLPATTANILGTIRWILTQNPGRGTEPGPAMLNALNLKPDTIWLLSDGEFNPAIADDIRDANAGQRVMIHTIAFHDPSGQAVLRRIAQENRGQFRYVVGR